MIFSEAKRPFHEEYSEMVQFLRSQWLFWLLQFQNLIFKESPSGVQHVPASEGPSDADGATGPR